MSFYRAPTSVHHGSPIKLTSANLTRLTNALDARKEDRKKYGEEYRRLAKLDRPDIRGQTNTSYTEPAKHATIDVSGPRVVVTKTETGLDPNEAARFADDVARIERGEDITERPDIRTQMNQVARKAAATEVVIEKLEEEFRAEFLKLSAAYCKTIKSKHDEKMKRLFKALIEVHAVNSEIYAERQDLIDSSIGFNGIVFGLTPDFLGNPRDQHSDFAEFLREGHKRGLVTSVPMFL
jgi:hypothetical protein